VITARSVFVIDASVYVADARPSEPFHAEAKTVLRAMADRGATLVLPAIALAEVAGALVRAIGDPQLAQATAEMYGQWPGARVAAVDEALGILACEIASEARLKGCDAVYVALARVYGAVLVSLDREQIARSPTDVTARTPGELLVDLSAM
jgi:predicted nucleic acid-binding protein